jgi:hypothetical protein
MEEYLSLAADGSIYRLKEHFSLALDGSAYRAPRLDFDWRGKQVALSNVIRPSEDHNRGPANHIRQQRSGGLGRGGF